MVVLQWIGIILAIVTVYMTVVWINRYTYKKYKYDFFNKENFIITAIGYGFIFFGARWLSSAMAVDGDLLNGQILLGIGIFIIIFVIYTNVINTAPYTGLFLSIFQLALYVGLSVIAFYALIILIAALAQTKPVYVINND